MVEWSYCNARNNNCMSTWKQKSAAPATAFTYTTNFLRHVYDASIQKKVSWCTKSLAEQKIRHFSHRCYLVGLYGVRPLLKIYMHTLLLSTIVVLNSCAKN